MSRRTSNRKTNQPNALEAEQKVIDAHLRTISDIHEPPDTYCDSLKKLSLSTLTRVLGGAVRNHRGRKRVAPYIYAKDYESLGPKRGVEQSAGTAHELRWMTALLLAHQEQVRSYIRLRSEFLTALLVGDYTASEYALAKCTRTHGFSLWSIQSRLLLAEQTGGTRENRRYFTEIQKLLPVGFPQYLTVYLSYRTERTTSNHSYEASLRDSLSYLNDDRFKSTVQTAFFLLLSQYNLWLNDSGCVIATLARQPLPDVYNSFVQISQSIYADDDVPSSTVSVLAACVEALADSVNDLSLALVAQLLSPGRRFPQSDILSMFYGVLDAHTRGDYGAAIVNATRLLEADPSCIHAYLLHIDSHLQSGMLPVPPFQPDTIAYDIYTSLANVESANKSAQDGLDRLLKWCLVFDSMPIGRQLYSY